MSAAHTPGPWNPEWKGSSWVIDGVGVVTAHTPHAPANARLIAAAPDLARTLADLLADAVDMNLDDSPVSGSLVAAREALRKAGVL